MANNERFLLKQFSGDANNNGVFGSYESDNATVSNDPDTIQSLPAYETGWEDATTSGAKLPRLEEMQGLQYLFCKAIKELYSEGIAFWMAGETYYLNSICAYFDENNDFALYRNISGTNGSNIPPEDTVNWVKLVIDGADKDLSNLTLQGKNISNWSSNITNCITEIPQDIKLELNNGAVTLKTGSKLYIPNGFETDGTTPKFDNDILQNDVTRDKTACSFNGQFMLLYNTSGYIDMWLPSVIESGNTQPGTNIQAWFSLTDNKIYYNQDLTGRKFYFPLGLISCNSTDGAISIEQVFNGFGYIGSTKFILPGVKGLIPNGKNDDESFRSIPLNITEVRIFTSASTDSSVVGVVGVNNITNYNATELVYDEASNYMYHSGEIVYQIPYTNIYSQVSGKIDSNIKFKTVFHAVDYNEFNEHKVIEFLPPSADTNYIWYRLYNDGWVEQGGEVTITNDDVTVILPIKMSDLHYKVYLGLIEDTSSGGTATEGWVRSRTPTIIILHVASQADGMCWQVSGMSAR